MMGALLIYVVDKNIACQSWMSIIVCVSVELWVLWELWNSLKQKKKQTKNPQKINRLLS